MRATRRRRERGMLLGVVLILMTVVLLGGALAIWSVPTDTAAAGNDRLARQLLDCAEQGLEWGKQYFSGSGLDWNSYLQSNTVCASSSPLSSACYPNGPLRGGTATPPSTAYPASAPFTQTVTMGGQAVTVSGSSFTPAPVRLTWSVGIYDNAEVSESSTDGGTQNYLADTDGNIGIYARCVDPGTGQSRAVTAFLRTTVPSSIDYTGQAGFGFRNQGNQN